MPEATLTFKLPRDKEEFDVASNAVNLYLCLWDMDQYLRSVHKYDKDGDKIREDPGWHIRDKLHEIMNMYGVSLEMMS